MHPTPLHIIPTKVKSGSLRGPASLVSTGASVVSGAIDSHGSSSPVAVTAQVHLSGNTHTVRESHVQTFVPIGTHNGRIGACAGRVIPAKQCIALHQCASGYTIW